MSTHSKYLETLNFLYENLPMFQRVGAVAYKKDLTNTVSLCDGLGNPQNKFRSVHVAGTNGKGSSSHMIAAILQRAGCKTGLYTSPHLKEFTERIRINGEQVSKEFVIDFVERIKPSIEHIQPSFFEITVAMAFDYFARQKVDIAVIEVGLGGRLDSTNVITPLVSLITNISFDHKDILGDTLKEIASEKAGIIKSDIPVVVSEFQEEVFSVFEAKAKEMNAPLTLAAKEIVYDGENLLQNGRMRYEHLISELKGSYQAKNIPGVIATIGILRESGFTITDEAIRSGIEGVATITGLKGRWQKLSEGPLMIADTGHNEAGITEVVKQIKKQKYIHLHVVLGMVKDKDINNVLALLPKDATYYFCQAKIPRAMPALQLAEKASQFDLKGKVVEDVNEAIARAKHAAAKEDFIFIGGSTFVVAEIHNL